MPEGYIGKKPDASFWMQQVYAGIEYRRTYAREGDWPRWRQYYRGQWKAGTLPHNLFFSMRHTIVPRVYFRNPSVSVSPGWPGFEGMAFAQIVQRSDNKLIDKMNLKREMKRVIRDAFLFGTGVSKLGWGAQFSPTPEEGTTAEPFAKDGERFEYRDDVVQDQPWIARVPPGEFIVPAGLQTFQDARWVAHWVRRPVDDVRRDPRFRPGLRDLGAQGVRSLGTLSETHSRIDILKKEYVEHIDLVEIRDKKFQKVFVIAPHGVQKDGKVLFFDDDAYTNNGAFNYFPIIFNEDDEVFWGVPDSVTLEPYQLEVNEIRTQAMKHRRLSLVKLLYKKGLISETEITKMMQEDVIAAIGIDGDDDIRTVVQSIQVANIPVDLRAEMAAVLEDVRETIGFSRNQLGEYNSKTADTTATEANIVKQATEIRVDERRDLVADVLVQMVGSMHNLMFTHWTEEHVVDIVGPGGVPVWVKFKPQMLNRGQYIVKVDPDSSVPETKQMREAKAVQVYSLLTKNPLVDPMKVTKYLLTELHGVQFDDMMRALPPIMNGMGSMQSPMSPQDLAGAIPQQLQLLQKLAARRGVGKRPQRALPARNGSLQ